MNTRPLHTVARTNSSIHITTPRSSGLLALLGGGLTYDGLALTKDEVRALQKLYGYSTPQKLPPPKEGRDQSQKVEDFHQAGADRNLIRHANLDGLRLVAWLAKFVDEGKDPLAFLVRVMLDAGYDVDIEDTMWVEGTPDDPPDSEPGTK